MTAEISRVIKVYRDKDTGMWYWENSRGAKSQAIFKNKKQAWAKGNQYIDYLFNRK